VRRWIVTGAPAAGKTTLLAELARRGHAVVPEAATEVVARLGHDADRGLVLDEITALQHSRQSAPVPAEVRHQLFDRSPVCTLALARHMGDEPTAALQAELDRIATYEIYERRVVYVAWSGRLAPTDVRRITAEQTVDFDRTHRQTYLELGYELVEVPVVDVADRADLVEAVVGPP
jgi:predicted ATPase